MPKAIHLSKADWPQPSDIAPATVVLCCCSCVQLQNDAQHTAAANIA